MKITDAHKFTPLLMHQLRHRAC